MADVWDSTIDDSTHVAVLVCLANFADDDGTNCFPGIARVARMTRYSKRTVMRAVAALVKQDWLRIVQRGSGRLSTGYHINVTKLQGVSAESPLRTTQRPRGGGTVSPLR